MLVYVNSFLFEPAQGPDQIVQLVAKWVGQRAKSYVDAARLAEGIRELKLKDGSTLTSRATWSDDKGKTYPFWFCAQLSHRDEKIAGRRWITEIGLHQEAEGQPIECSLLLRTDEVSARVTASIQVTRPKLVEQLIQSCNPLGQTPGLKVKQLTLESASAFLREVERDDRRVRTERGGDHDGDLVVLPGVEVDHLAVGKELGNARGKDAKVRARILRRFRPAVSRHP